MQANVQRTFEATRASPFGNELASRDEGDDTCLPASVASEDQHVGGATPSAPRPPLAPADTAGQGPQLLRRGRGPRAEFSRAVRAGQLPRTKSLLDAIGMGS